MTFFDNFGELFTVKRLIIGDDLFGKIGKFKQIRQNSSSPNKISQFLDIPVLEIAKLILCQIVIFERAPNIRAAKYSRFTVCCLITLKYPSDKSVF